MERGAVRTRRKATGRRRTIEQMKLDARALDLRLQGMGYQQISDQLGWKSVSRAFEACKRARADIQRDNLEQVDYFTEAVERIQMGLRHCQEIIDTPHYLAGRDGKIVTMEVDGEVVKVLDSAPKQRAITEMRHLNDQLICLMDLKPAAKSRVEVVTDDVVQREIDQLSKEIAEAGKNSPIPSE